MTAKSVLVALGAGMAAGTAVGLMLPRNPTMRQAGRDLSAAAADKMQQAADKIEQTLG